MSPFKVGRVLNIKYLSINHNQTIRQFKPETVIGFALFKSHKHTRTQTHTHARKQRILILSCKCRSHQNSKPAVIPGSHMLIPEADATCRYFVTVQQR